MSEPLMIPVEFLGGSLDGPGKVPFPHRDDYYHPLPSGTALEYYRIAGAKWTSRSKGEGTILFRFRGHVPVLGRAECRGR